MYYLWGHPGRNPLLIFQYLRNFGDCKLRDEERNANVLAIDNTLYVEVLTLIFDCFDKPEMVDVSAEGFGDAIDGYLISTAAEALFH